MNRKMAELYLLVSAVSAAMTAEVCASTASGRSPMASSLLMPS